LILQIFGLALPTITAVLVDRIIPFKLNNVMTLLALGMVMLVCSQIVVSLLRDWILVYLRARIDIHMMLNFFEHLLSLPYNFFLQRSAGDLLTRMGSNSVIRDVLSNQLVSTLLDCSTIFIYFCILLSLSLPYTLLTLTIGILEAAIVFVTYRPVREVAKRELAAQGKAQGYLAEALSGIATLKAAGAEPRAFERWSNLFFEQLNVSLRRSYLTTIAGTALSALRAFSSLALLWIGVQQVLQGSLSIGTMLALNSLAGAFLAPLSSLVSSAQQLQLVQANLTRLADIMTTAPEQNRQETVMPPRLTGHIRLENVSFQYAPGSPHVLHHIALSIRAGQKVAIVGRTGSGKSTLGRLLLGLYLPTEGTILYDEISLQRMQLQDVRRQFGVVLQDSAIFSGTMLQNITLNNPSMSREQAMRAAWMAAIHEDILRMPMRYDTQVSEGGAALSGGQRQRIAIARAVANNPSILLLDEATSHLDVLTEQRVARNLESISCTQIIIAHRLSTIRAADVILVMDNGTIIEYGSHRQLLRRNGHYAQLVRQQMEKPEHEKASSRSSM
jgi:ATP-binding cassette subfamily B protein